MKRTKTLSDRQIFERTTAGESHEEVRAPSVRGPYDDRRDSCRDVDCFPTRVGRLWLRSLAGWRNPEFPGRDIERAAARAAGAAGLYRAK